MRSSRNLCLVLLLASLICSIGLARMNAKSVTLHPGNFNLRSEIIDSYHGREDTEYVVVPRSEGGGVKEDIGNKYKARYEKWKAEFLSTATGKEQWDSYAQSPDFLLTITISDDNSKGASTGKYKWDSSGKLVAATITLGTHIDEGFPNPIYYPVMNSLSQPEQYRKI